MEKVALYMKLCTSCARTLASNFYQQTSWGRNQVIGYAARYEHRLTGEQGLQIGRSLCDVFVTDTLDRMAD